MTDVLAEKMLAVARDASSNVPLSLLLYGAVDRIRALEANELVLRDERDAARLAFEAQGTALADARSGLRYIRQRYGALEGVGWDRVLGDDR